MRNKILFTCMLIITLVISVNIHAQNKQQAPEFVEAPDWLVELMNNSDGVNYKETIERFNSFRQSLPNNGKKTPYNKSVINYFKWWKRMYEPFVGSDGIIHLPNQQDLDNIIANANNTKALENSNNRLRALNNQGLPVGNWSVLSPMITYEFKTKKPALWQSNIRRVDASNSEPNIIYVGTDTGMVFKTTNAGEKWEPCSPLKYYGGEMNTLEVSNTDSKKVVIGAAMTLWLTEDGGDNWTMITPPTNKKFQHIRDAVFDPQNDDKIIVGTDDGVYVSDNNGQNWKRKLSGRCFDIKYQQKKNGNARIYLLLDESNDPKGYVNLYVSENNGDSFEKKIITSESGELSCGRIAVSMTDPNYVYVFACRYPNNQRPYFAGDPCILKSTDAGESFTFYDIKDQVHSMDSNGGQGYYDMIATVSHNDPEHIMFGILFLYSSHNGGKTLDKHEQVYPQPQPNKATNIAGYYGKYDLHTDMQDIDVAPDGTTWLTTDGGIVFSKDFFATEPEPKNNGIYASEFWGFDQGWNEDIIVGGRNHNGDMSQNIELYEGKTIAMRGSENPTGYVFLSNPRKIAFSDTRQKMIMPDKWTGEFKDFEGAESFNVFPYESTVYGMQFEYDPRYAKSFLIVTDPFSGKRDATKRMLWRTTDDGLSYTLVHTFDRDISSYAISRSNPNKIVVAVSGQLHYSMDAGQSWQEMPIIKDMTYTNNYKIAIHPKDENEIWATTDNVGEVFRTKDNGLNWENLNDGLSMPTIDGSTKAYSVRWFFMTGNEKNAVYAIANNTFEYDGKYTRNQSRIMYHDDTLNGWVDISQGLPALMRINRMKPFFKDAKVRIATDNGVWQMPLIDEDFAPIAQPIILNIGSADEKGKTELIFDSYSIANQNGAKWHWQIEPKPISMSANNTRQIKVTIDPNQTYDIILTVTSKDNKSDRKVVKSMIKGSKPVPDYEIEDPSNTTAISEVYSKGKEVDIFPTLLSSGDNINVSAKNINDSKMKVTIYDTNGNKVNVQYINNNGQISTNGLSSGVHIYVIETKDFKKVGRFLIK